MWSNDIKCKFSTWLNKSLYPTVFHQLHVVSRTPVSDGCWANTRDDLTEPDAMICFHHDYVAIYINVEDALFIIYWYGVVYYLMGSMLTCTVQHIEYSVNNVVFVRLQERQVTSRTATSQSVSKIRTLLSTYVFWVHMYFHFKNMYFHGANKSRWFHPHRRFIFCIIPLWVWVF